MDNIKTNEGNLSLTSDKELLEEFFNSIDIKDNTTGVESISDEMRLNKFLWIIKQKEIEINKCQLIADESINRTTEWLNDKKKKTQEAINFLTNQMSNYLNNQDLKSLSLPNGIIGLRKQPTSIIISDEALFFANAKAEMLRHTPESFSADLKFIKNYIKENDIIPKGVEVLQQDPKFYYKISES